MVNTVAELLLACNPTILTWYRAASHKISTTVDNSSQRLLPFYKYKQQLMVHSLSTARRYAWHGTSRCPVSVRPSICLSVTLL